MNLVFAEQISESSMSSDLFMFDGYYFQDPFSPFSESSIDIHQAFPETCHNLTTPLEENDHFTPTTTTTTTTLLSNSPPSHQLEALSLNYQNTHMGILDLPALEVKTEEFQMAFYPSPHNDYSSSSNSSSFHLSQSYGGTGSGAPGNAAVKMMQRSYSSNSFEGKQLKSGKSFLFQPKFDSLVESPNLHSQLLTSPDHSFSSASSQIRRVCSTGDLQNVKTSHGNQRLSSSPLGTESSFMEEANFKVGRYSAEERKERILRYRAKRTQRNFNKTIKYACRKTLADNRPRIRGRFARNDEPGEAPKTITSFNRYEDDDDLWIDGFHEDDEDGMVGRGKLFGSYDPTWFQYGYA